MKIIAQLVDDLDSEHILSKETKENIVKSLIKFNQAAILKFIKGQKEHGGNLDNRDLDQEIANETIDFFWYNEAKKWRKT